MVAWVMRGQRKLGGTRVTATFFNTYSPASGCAMCAPRVIFCSIFCSLFAC
ncbi:hypothetical protein BSU04_34270 [Caballeronia sordidicola]|uniref:Uncharacterized protein n=1 Tax=Caballeronia sordidicola TaxID=196367 RepID=A0A226WSZ1_CABSO|nr:hypothetical protein BSU04_34270 [Caballeronia sordidicola]